MKHGFVKAAAGTPRVRVADCAYNAEQIILLMTGAAEEGVKVLTLPELCLTGCTCGDLFLHDTLLDGAEAALERILQATAGLDMVTALGLPLRGTRNGAVYNCAALIHKGKLLGLAAKTFLSPEESRRFSAPAPGSSVRLLEQTFSLEGGTVYPCSSLPGLVLGVEVGDDGAALCPPSAALAAAGATLILNPAASPALAGRADRDRALVSAHTARLKCGWVRSGAGEGESTTDVVYGAHRLISECGRTLAEGRFSCRLTLSEVDVDHITRERRAAPGFHARASCEVSFHLERAVTRLTRPFPANPFLPEHAPRADLRCRELLHTAALGLKKRLEHTGAPCAVVGLSGGLDSTLAILTVARAFDLLGRERNSIVAVTMPCFGTTARTKSNAEKLAEELGTDLRVIDISAAVRQHFADIGHDENDHSVTFENAQARERTQVLMDVANQVGGLVIGTGDLSELALGWCTYNGDHMSMYAVNASIPKTLVRHLVAHLARDNAKKDEELKDVLEDILDTPVSPELLPAVQGQIAQKTEDLVGPYELHDFFLY